MNKLHSKITFNGKAPVLLLFVFALSPVLLIFWQIFLEKLQRNFSGASKVHLSFPPTPSHRTLIGRWHSGLIDNWIACILLCGNSLTRRRGAKSEINVPKVQKYKSQKIQVGHFEHIENVNFTFFVKN